MSEVKIEDAGLCKGCLTSHRKLSSIEKYLDLFTLLTTGLGLNKQDSTHTKAPQMCWECIHILKNIKIFRDRVIQAQLILDFKNDTSQVEFSLSSLSTVMKDSYDLIVYESDKKAIKAEENVQVIPPGSEIDTKIFDVDLVNVIKSENYDDVDNYDMEIYGSEVDIKKEDNVIKSTRKRCPNKKNKYRLVDVGAVDVSSLVDKFTINADGLKEYQDRLRQDPGYANRKFKCETCIVGFYSEKSYLMHKKRFHNKRRPYQCDICGMTFISKSPIKSHLATHYVRLQCRQCDFTCSLYKKMYAHVYHTHSRLFQCIHCGMTFFNCRHFYAHYRNLHEKYICDYCQRHFYSRDMIKQHILVRHTNLHHCRLCPSKFRRYHSLLSHKQEKHDVRGARDAYCVECDMRFATRMLYTRHLQLSVRHGNRKTIPCPVCGKIYTKRYSMNNHYKLVHVRQTDFYCDKCERYFLNSFRLRQHRESVHEKKEKPKDKLCVHCGRGFATNRTLQNHVRTHTGERPHACTFCTSKFAQRTALVTHARAVHKVDVRQRGGGGNV